MHATPKAANGLTYWASRGVYRKVVGGRCFYLGSDPHAAAAEAAAIRSQWRRLKVEGHQTWPPGEPDRQSIRRALGLGIGTSHTLRASPADQTVPVREAAELVSAKSITVEQAANLYMDEQRKGDVGERWINDIAFRLGRAIDVLGRAKPMNTIGQSELVDFAAFWRKRPPKIGQKAKAKSQVSVLYAARVVAALKSFLSWASDHPDIAWSRPPRFDALLLIRTNRPTTSAEKEVIKARVLGESSRINSPMLSRTRASE